MYIGSKRLFDITAEGKDGNSAFIRFSANADGTDFTETWSEGQNYVGFATAQEAPTDKGGYTWLYFAPKNDDHYVPNLADSVANACYTLNGDKQNNYTKFSVGADAITIVKRDNRGAVRGATPVNDADLTPKKYVDGELKKYATQQYVQELINSAFSNIARAEGSAF